MRVISWNVNGLRACVSKGFMTWLRQSGADIVGVQETRARVEQLPAHVQTPRRWHAHFVAAKRAGYSGVGLFSKRAPDHTETSLGAPRFDNEGRVQMARFGRLLVVNAYFPNGSGPNRDHSRIPYKLAFYRKLFQTLETEKAAGGRILVMGDFNTAHRDIDLARPRDNQTTSGFTPKERNEFDRWIRSGWVDTFRYFNQKPGHYSWWSNRQGVRERNIGWRIDYVLASPAAMEHVQRAFIRSRIKGSDHCPVGVDVNPKIVG